MDVVWVNEKKNDLWLVIKICIFSRPKSKVFFFSYLSLIARCILMVKGENRRPDGTLLPNVSPSLLTNADFSNELTRHYLKITCALYGSMTFRRHHLVKVHIFLQTKINFKTNPPYQNKTQSVESCCLWTVHSRSIYLGGQECVCGKGMPVSLIIVISFVITTPETYLHKRIMLLTFR
jgi:hypothetical protein